MGPNTERRTARTTRTTPVKKDNTIPIIAGCVGGLFLLIIIIAAAASGGGGGVRPAAKRKSDTPVRAPVTEAKQGVGRTMADLGAIMFVCSNSPAHEDKEVVFDRCTNCPFFNRFFWDEASGAYRCFACKKLFSKSEVKCPECGKVPNRTKIKHR